MARRRKYSANGPLLYALGLSPSPNSVLTVQILTVRFGQYQIVPRNKKRTDFLGAECPMTKPVFEHGDMLGFEYVPIKRNRGGRESVSFHARLRPHVHKDFKSACLTDSSLQIIF
jgi:hypothetical protein